MAIRRRLFMPPACDGGGTGFLTFERPCGPNEWKRFPFTFAMIARFNHRK
jgi:hypothetical protein